MVALNLYSHAPCQFIQLFQRDSHPFGGTDDEQTTAVFHKLLHRLNFFREEIIFWGSEDKDLAFLKPI